MNALGQYTRRGRAMMSAIVSLPLLWGSVTVSEAGTGTTTLNFTATFVQGTCDIYANSLASANVTLVSASPSAITAAGAAGVNPKDFEINFANCTNVVGGLPQLKLSGTSINTPGNEIFRDAGASTGYGIRVVEKGQTTHLKNGDFVTMTGFLNTHNLNTLNGAKKEFTASLSCGDCTSLALTPGNLTAAVVFDFIYN